MHPSKVAWPFHFQEPTNNASGPYKARPTTRNTTLRTSRSRHFRQRTRNHNTRGKKSFPPVAEAVPERYPWPRSSHAGVPRQAAVLPVQARHLPRTTRKDQVQAAASHGRRRHAERPGDNAPSPRSSHAFRFSRIPGHQTLSRRSRFAQERLCIHFTALTAGSMNSDVTSLMSHS